ncbi:phosphoserine phosphatase SerB [Salinibacterium sp. dk2585]|uniref:phosphoserine phosphatase SerB n=1 Tax=unclassified Salinibacterium TaxID=2632331 RepID=UPI0011C25333|nr:MULTISPECIES: phosphoserine phosphatase SerB [unclassified Salinibacterium]QEE61212.1 phosphoserine phosphatase SerB [Salinibacterium sp. dk2585]TXK53887.1 phosphoserine phosphatase SerB [Salinibacterium sp. dk5596]
MPFLVVLDVDSTLIENEVIELLAEEAGSLELVADVTARAMNGEIDFAESLRLRVATLEGLPVSAFETVRARVEVTKGVPELVAGLHAVGGRIGVVSGGFHEIVDPFAAELRLDYCRANRLETRDGVLTGRVLGGVIHAEAKADAIAEWALDAGVPMRCTVAVGDGANDLRMMERAGLSIAFDAKAPVRQAADLVLDERDLSLVLGALGLDAG